MRFPTPYIGYSLVNLPNSTHGRQATLHSTQVFRGIGQGSDGTSSVGVLSVRRFTDDSPGKQEIQMSHLMIQHVPMDIFQQEHISDRVPQVSDAWKGNTRGPLRRGKFKKSLLMWMQDLSPSFLWMQHSSRSVPFIS